MNNNDSQIINLVANKMEKEIKNQIIDYPSTNHLFLNQKKQSEQKSNHENLSKDEISNIFSDYSSFAQKKIKSPVNKALLNAWFTALETSEVNRISAFLQLITTCISMVSSFTDFWESEKNTLCFEARDFETEYSVLELVTDSLADSILEKSQIVGILQNLQGQGYRYHYDHNKVNKTNLKDNIEIIIDFNFKKLTKNYFPVEMNIEFLNIPDGSLERENLINSLLSCFGGETSNINEIKKLIKIPEVLLDIKLHPLATNPMMQFILSIFSGTNSKKTRGLDDILKKPLEERTEEELMIIDNYMSPVIEIIPSVNYTSSGTVDASRYNAIIKNNKIVMATSELKELSMSREELLLITTAKLIKDCFSTKGLMYFLAINYLIYKKGKNGLLYLEIDDLLEALHYKRDPSGSFNSRLKKEASEIIKLFGTLSIQMVNKSNKKERDTLTLNLFSLPLIREIESDNKGIIKGQFLLRAESWIMDSYFPIDNKAPQFTYVFDSILEENYSEKPLAIFLYIFFSIRWRIDLHQEFKITTLFNWLDIDYESKSGKHNRMHYLQELEKELNYMKSHGYLAGWKIKLDGQYINSKITELDKPFDNNYIIVPLPPEVIKKKIIEIKDKRELYVQQEVVLEAPKNNTLLTHSEFMNILEISDLSITAFAKKVGVSRETLSRIKSGKMSISLEISNKIKENFNDMATGQLTLFSKDDSISSFLKGIS